MNKILLYILLLLPVGTCFSQNDTLHQVYLTIGEYQNDMSYSSDANKFDSLGIIYFESIGETFWRSIPFTGWTGFTSGKVPKPDWDAKNPYDNHPYASLGTSTYLSQKGRSPGLIYRIENGKKYTGLFIDSIVNKLGEKELSFKGAMLDGLLNGEVTFYFTSNDIINTSGNSEKVVVGKIKSSGKFENGKMIGSWNYFGFFGRLDWKRYVLLEERYYEVEKQFPVKVISYRFLVTVSHGKHSLYGNLSRVEEIVDSNKGERFETNDIYQVTYYHADYDTLTENTVYGKGRVLLTSDYAHQIGHWEFFHKNGNLKREGYFINNRESGVWTTYYDNGQKRCIYEYTDGVPKRQEYWDKKGKPIIKNGIKIKNT